MERSTRRSSESSFLVASIVFCLRVVSFGAVVVWLGGATALAQTAQPVRALNCHLQNTILVGGQPAICKPFADVPAGSAAVASASDHAIASCSANQFVIGQSTTWALTCLQPNFTNLAGTIADAQLPVVITAAGPIGDATHVAQITFDAKGRLTTVSSVAISGVAPSGAAGGDLSGTYPNPTVAKVNGVAYPASPGTNSVPVVTGSNTVTYAGVPSAALNITTTTCSNQFVRTISSGAVGGCATVANADLTNSAITITAGTAIGVTGSPVSLGGAVTITNTGVTSIIAGTGISVDAATGAVTVTASGIPSSALNITTTACINQFVRTVSSGAVGGCASIVTADLPTSGVAAASYGSAGTIPVISVDATGRITSAFNAIVSITEININTASQVRIAGLGLGNAAPANGAIISLLGANNVTAYKVTRFTNTSPTGKYLDFLDSTGAPVFVVGITGIVTTGTWNGTPITEAFGGTGQTTYTKGDLLCASAATTLTKLAVGANGTVVTADSAETCGVKWAAGGGTGTVTSSGTPLIHQVAVFTTATDIKGITVGATGTVFTGVSSADPSFSTSLLLNTAASFSTNGTAQFQVTGTTGGDILAVTDGTRKFSIFQSSVPRTLLVTTTNDQLQFGTNNTARAGFLEGGSLIVQSGVSTYASFSTNGTAQFQVRGATGGDIVSVTDGTRIFGIFQSSSVGTLLVSNSNHPLVLGANNTQWLTIGTGGVITLNTTNYNTCTALTTTSAVLTCTVSDARLKQDREPFIEGLAVLRKIHPETWAYIPGTVYFDGFKRHAGLVADDLSLAHPLLTSWTNDPTKGGLRQLEPYAIQAVVINSIQQLDHEIAQLKMRLADLESRRN